MFSPVFLLNPVVGIIAFLAIALLIAGTNAVMLTRLERSNLPTGQESDPAFLSVLIPVRNEEENISRCVVSLLEQDYPNYEVLVLNDHSNDSTGEILAKLAAQDNRLRILDGLPLPEDWLGKNWACQQLSQAANGELLLFIDADTIHHPSTVSRAVTALDRENVDMLTALPRQIVLTWGERLVVPIVYFVLLSLLPLPIAYRLRLPVFSAAIGQFMLFRRKAYEQIGGYAAVHSHGVDDLALARLVKLHRLPWRMADGGAYTSTRMYRNFHETSEGFTKNLFAAFNYRLLPFLFAWLWIGYVFFRPPIELVLNILRSSGNLSTQFLCAVAIAESLLLWSLIIIRFRFPRFLFLLYPFIVFLGVFIAMRSVVLGLRGQTTWKDRKLGRAKIHWI